jgi:hypothetical protein
MNLLDAALWQEPMAAVLSALSLRANSAQSKILYHPARLKYLGGGERAGKSFTAAQYGIGRYGADLITNPGPHERYVYWLMGEDYAQCRGELEYLQNFLVELDDLDIRASSRPRRDQWILSTRHNAQFESHTAADPKKLGVVAPRGIIGCEAGLWNQETYLRFVGRLAEKRGWGICTGSFESSYSHYAGVWYGAQARPSGEEAAFSLPSWSNPAIYPLGEQDPQILFLKEKFPFHRFMERFGGVPSKPTGTVFHLFDPLRHIKDIEYDRSLPVQLWVDPGYVHPYAILVVQLPPDGSVRVIDERYLFRHTHKQAIGEVMRQAWWPNVTRIVIDVASKRETTDGPAGERTWELDTGKPVYSAYHLVKDSIARVTDFLSVDRILVSPRCRGLIAEMGGGPAHPDFPGMTPWKYEVGADGGINVDKPTSKWDDACKALAYGILNVFGEVDKDGRMMEEMNYLFGKRGDFRPIVLPGDPKLSSCDAWMNDLAQKHQIRLDGLKKQSQSPASTKLWRI